MVDETIVQIIEYKPIMAISSQEYFNQDHGRSRHIRIRRDEGASIRRDLHRIRVTKV